MYGSITLHIHNITHFVRLQVRGEMFNTCFSKRGIWFPYVYHVDSSLWMFILISVTICSLI